MHDLLHLLIFFSHWLQHLKRVIHSVPRFLPSDYVELLDLEDLETVIEYLEDEFDNAWSKWS